MRTSLLRCLVLALAAASGCRSIGPGTVPRDRFDYSEAIGVSWKRQTLLNIVKLRYFDPPVFVDVGQIVGGYSLETTASMGTLFASGSAPDQLSLGLEGRFTDRPTITYVPLTGDRFLSGLMTPIPPAALFSAIQSGWPADALFALVLTSINGLRTEDRTVDGWSPPDPRFLRASELLRELQLSGAVSIRVLLDAQKNEALVVTLRAADISPETLALARELRALLGLSQDATEFRLVFGFLPADDQEIAVVTRSVLHVIMGLSTRADLPAGDVEEGRATPGIPDTERSRGFRIHSSPDEPGDAFVSVRYRDAWFWIDDRDLMSKRAFAFVLLLFTMTDSDTNVSAPQLTISAQ